MIFSGLFKMNLGKSFTFSGKKPEVSLGVRSEDIDVVTDTAPDAIPGTVILVEPIGSDTLLNVEISDKKSCKVRVPASFQVHEGDNIKLKLKQDKIHLFDAEDIRIARIDE